MEDIFENIINFILPQHRAKKDINNYIKAINSIKKSVWKKYYYKYVRDKIAIKYNVCIGTNCKIGGGIAFPHPMNIVIGDGVIIGNGCTIFNNVTIGQKEGKYPIIGNNVTIYPGSIIIGEITIGNNVVIGANSLVCKSIKNNTVVAGNPATVIKSII